MILDEEDQNLANFLEAQVLSHQEEEEEEEEEDEDEDGKPKAAKRRRRQEEDEERETTTEIIPSSSEEAKEKRKASASSSSSSSCRIASGIMSKIPAEIFPHILKFLSSEDLIACSLVCRFLNNAASDESLWRRLYCMRWGLLPPSTKLRQCPWKKLYIQRDEEDMVELVRNCPSEFKEYYIQMQAAKRTQPPLPSQVIDDRVILDKTVADQVSIWKSSRGLTDKVVMDHACSGETCSYYQIGDVFVCEKTGHVHVCDDTCREVVLDPTNELLVCTISGHCFDRLLSPAEMEPDNEQQQGGITDEAEPFMGSGRFARAYLLGYNCADEKELEAALRMQKIIKRYHAQAKNDKQTDNTETDQYLQDRLFNEKMEQLKIKEAILLEANARLRENFQKTTGANLLYLRPLIQEKEAVTYCSQSSNSTTSDDQVDTELFIGLPTSNSLLITQSGSS